MPMGRRARFLPLLLLVGCARADGMARGPAPGAPFVVGLESQAGAASYSTRPTDGAVRGGLDADRVERALHDIARARNMHPAGDGRLADLASFIGGTVGQAGEAPSPSTVDAYSRKLGLVEPIPLFMVFGLGDDGGPAAALEDMLRSAPRSVAYNRYGISVLSRFGQRLAVVVLSVSSAELEPLPRRVGAGATLSLRGRLRDKYKRPQVEITLPNGSTKHIAEKPGTDIDFALPVQEAGIHRVELLADGPYGIEVVANFPVFAGVEEPPVRVEMRASSAVGAEADQGFVAGRLLSLLNGARKAAGVPPLKENAGLAQVAEAHSKDMVASGFFGHVSPVNGDPAARVRRKGLGFVLIAENVGRGSTADEVHAMLLDSPGHRANALDPKLTDVGIGVAIDQQGGRAQIVATQEFGGVSKPLDLSAAPDDLLRMINARRGSAGAGKLDVDPALTEAARKGVALFFADPLQSQDQVVQRVNGDLVRPAAGKASPIAKRMRAAQSFLLPVISLDHAAKIDQLFDPTARYIGIGVARGARPETGPDTTGVLVVIGWPR
jgi:uncharacterized protein YkwD